MDFKLTGTREGMTAIQMELKVQGLPIELLDSIFERSRNARQKVLDVMESAIKEPRKEVNEHAPKIRTIRIPLEKVGAVIGSGGSVIKEITGGRTNSPSIAVLMAINCIDENGERLK